MPVETASGDAAPAPDSRQSGVGELLQKSRKDLGLSLEQVADQLHLDEHIVEALEAENFDEIGAPVFVRGHLKAYARVLRMDEDQVLGAYRAAMPEESAEPVLTRRGPEAKLALNPGPFGLGALAVILVVALAIYVLRDESVDTPVESEPLTAPPAAENILPEPGSVETLTEAIPPPAAAEGLVEESVAAAAEGAEPAATTVADAPAEAVEVLPAPARGDEVDVAAEASAPATRIALELYFREESWVEISNEERRILFGLQREGMRRQLTGEPPIQVLLGNATGVDIYLNSEPFAIPARNINGKVARFTIDPTTEGTL